MSDKHQLVINLARCIADRHLCQELKRRLDALPFHPAVLADAQARCRELYAKDDELPEKPFTPAWAVHYFVCCWMGRSHKAGTASEFSGGLSTRWNANGGDSNTRYRSAIESLDGWQTVMQRCSFHVLDAFEFLENCDDRPGHGIYCDPPFPEVGDEYRHKFDQEKHRRLAAKLATFRRARGERAIRVK